MLFTDQVIAQNIQMQTVSCKVGQMKDTTNSYRRY